MGLFNFFGNWNEKMRSERMENGVCPDCAGKGFFEFGFEFSHIEDCPACGGSGKYTGEA